MEVEEGFRQSVRQAVVRVREVAGLYVGAMRKLVDLYLGRESFV